MLLAGAPHVPAAAWQRPCSADFALWPQGDVEHQPLSPPVRQTPTSFRVKSERRFRGYPWPPLSAQVTNYPGLQCNDYTNSRSLEGIES